MKDGYISFNGYKTYYQLHGKSDGSKPPLLMLHGGPGSTHHYFNSFRKLAKGGRQVIFYDQFGCGKSSGRRQANMWTVKTFVDQVDAVRKDLWLTEIDLYGHSWGGMLAIEYLLTQPQGVRKAIISSGMISLPLYQQEVDKLVAQLPVPYASILAKYHKAGRKTSSKQYQKAYAEYSKRHLFRGNKWPKANETPPGERNDRQYHLMWGFDETYVKDGALYNWSVVERLPEIKVPALVLSGEYDELTPAQSKLTHQKIPNSQLKIIKNASHCHFIEQEAAVFKAITDFLDK